MKVLPSPKSRKEKIKWLGPGIIWLAAGAGGAGELLFPPRVGSLYGYTFLWILILSIFFKWIIVREIGRWAVCTGETFMDGLKRLDKTHRWPIWLILIPQLFIGSASVAGLGGSAATALILLWDIDIRIWFIIIVAAAMTFLLLGKYKGIENISTMLTALLALIAIVTAVSVFPPGEKFLNGFIPSIPPNTNYHEILPWLSYVLSGSAGMIWYSYWLPAKGYGASDKIKKEQYAQPIDSDQGKAHLKGWIRQMTLDLSIGVVAGTMIVIAFLILGAELLGPKNLVPEENKVAGTLGGMLEPVWGNAGYWFMIIGVFGGFWGTVLTNQDGWARMLANGVRILFPTAKSEWVRNELLVKKLFIVLVLSVVPIVIYLIAGEPVGLLQIGGIIQVTFIPFVAWFVLRMNIKLLPPELRPSRPTVLLVYGGAICFSICVIVYFLQLVSQ